MAAANSAVASESTATLDAKSAAAGLALSAGPPAVARAALGLVQLVAGRKECPSVLKTRPAVPLERKGTHPRGHACALAASILSTDAASYLVLAAVVMQAQRAAADVVLAAELPAVAGHNPAYLIDVG